MKIPIPELLDVMPSTFRVLVGQRIGPIFGHDCDWACKEIRLLELIVRAILGTDVEGIGTQAADAGPTLAEDDKQDSHSPSEGSEVAINQKTGGAEARRSPAESAEPGSGSPLQQSTESSRQASSTGAGDIYTLICFHQAQ